MGHSWAGGGMGLQVMVGRAVLNQGCTVWGHRAQVCAGAGRTGDAANNPTSENTDGGKGGRGPRERKWQFVRGWVPPTEWVPLETSAWPSFPPAQPAALLLPSWKPGRVISGSTLSQVSQMRKLSTWGRERGARGGRERIWGGRRDCREGRGPGGNKGMFGKRREPLGRRRAQKRGETRESRCIAGGKGWGQGALGERRGLLAEEAGEVRREGAPGERGCT